MALFGNDPVTGQPEWEKYALFASGGAILVLAFLIFRGAFNGSGGSAATGGAGVGGVTAPNSQALYYPTSDSTTTINYNNNSGNTTNNPPSNPPVFVGPPILVPPGNGYDKALTQIEDTLKIQSDLLDHLSHGVGSSSGSSGSSSGSVPPPGYLGPPTPAPKAVNPSSYFSPAEQAVIAKWWANRTSLTASEWQGLAQWWNKKSTLTTSQWNGVYSYISSKA